MTLQWFALSPRPPAGRIPWRPFMLALASVLFMDFMALAQDGLPDIAGIERQLAALEDDSALSEEDQATTRDLLDKAREAVEAANARAAAVATYEEAAAAATETRARLEAELASLQADDTPPDLPDTASGLRSRLSFLQAERVVQADRRKQLRSQRTTLGRRASAIAEEIAAARDALAELSPLPDPDADGPESLLQQARATLLQARMAARRAEIALLQRELQTLPERERIVAAELALVDAQIEALDAEISLIQQRQSEVRMDRADTAYVRAAKDLAAVGALAEPVRAMAEKNVELAGMLKAMADAALRVQQETRALSEQTLQIRQQADTVERVIETGRITDEVGTLLRQLRASLPSPQALRAAIEDTVEARATTQLNLILWQDQLRALQDQSAIDEFAYEYEGETDDDFETGPADTAPDAPDAPDAETGTEGTEPATAGDPPATEQLVALRTQLLRDLIAAGRAQADRLTDLEIGLTETLDEVAALRSTLDRRLLWLPSNTRPFRNLDDNLVSSAALLTSPGTVASLRQGISQALSAQSLPFLVALALAVFGLLGRRRIAADLARLNEAVGKIPRDKYTTTPLAILSCLALAMPMPAMLAAIPVPVLLHGTGDDLLRGLAAGTLAVAGLVLLVLFTRAVGQPNGVLTTHFNWSARALRVLHRPPPWFLGFSGLVLFTFAAAMASGVPTAQNGVGTVAFLLLSLVIAIVGYGVFDFDDGLVCQVVSEGTNSLFLLFGLPGFALAPLVIGALPLFGYLDTAVALQLRLLATAGIMIVLAIIYGVLRRVLLTAQRRLALRRALESRARRAAERSEREKSGEEGDDDLPAPVEAPSALQALEEERQRISNQTRRLLLYATAVAGLAGLLAIWAQILPAFGVANDITLWTGSGFVDGVRTAEPVTLLNFILFVVFIAAGLIAAYNIRGVLEIGPFQRLKLSQGSRFAIDTIIGYFLIGTGIVAGFLQLGIDWSRLQWIIAALGVGLGFGLQEIVANFISGLIILFERPVRVGDTVTIGELDGTVTNVAIRATTIRDFDNREVLLPNKAIITENVTNWTLRDSVMRITIPIGVAYGSDVDAVRALLLKIAQEENDVLESPEPRVFFMNHGDSSLDFEVRAFISTPNKRFRVRDELNTAINKALQDAGIEIPFPQRDLHLKSS